MTTELSYRDSHTKPGKGAEYDEHYATLSWRKYLWSQEQYVLDHFLDNYMGGQEIKLLDFACGTGRIAGFLESRVGASAAVDVSRSMLDEAQKKLQRTELIEADLTRNNILAGRTFNLITAFRFFLNAEPALRLEALSVMVSLLSEDGYLVFNNHRNKTSPLIWSRYFLSKVRKTNLRFMSISETRELARNVGLEIIRIYPVGLLPFPKVKLPDKYNHWVDRTAMRLRFSGIYSESPVVVCRHRKPATGKTN